MGVDGTSANPNIIGVSVKAGLTGAIIGGTTGLTPNGACTGACNAIVNSTDAGVVVDSSTGITIQGNQIEANANGGIRLQNGGNGGAGTPVVVSPTGGAPDYLLHVNAPIGGTVDVYKTDGTAPAQGKTYLTSKMQFGALGTDIDLTGLVTSGDRVVVTITNAGNHNTSPFSSAASVP